jgi:endonuclease/exonuclease/phosphatase family metal-dependent hydrolase
MAGGRGKNESSSRADNRPSLSKFQSILLRAIEGTPYPHVMLVDGNDDRGIDVGLMTKADYEIVRIRSHIYDRDADGTVFSRDCPEYTIKTPTGQQLVVLVNHFKSKGYGIKTAEKRKRQATRVAKIYSDLIAGGEANVVVLGDLNDTPDSDALAPLLGGTDLKDITRNSNFVSDGRPGTYKNGAKGQKIDYLLLSPALDAKVTGGGIFRMGVWGGKNGTLFAHYATMKREVEQASDHAALYADISL